MDIGITKTSSQVEDLSWLLQRGGYDPLSITLDMSKFTPATYAPNGFVRSGTPLGRITATKLYGPYDAAATDGRETCAGHLVAFVRVPANGRNAGAALYFAGVVKESNLPHAIDSAGKTDLAAWIRYV